MLPREFPPPARPGGREHNVRYDEATGLWWKYTKPNSAGYTVGWRENGEPFMLNALPLEYLERLERQNEVCGDDLQLAGLWNPQLHDWCIVTTQPDIIGGKASLPDLQAAFQRAGFELLPWLGIGYEGSLSFRKDGVDVWDVHPANVLLTAQDLPLPFDVILTPTPGSLEPCVSPIAAQI